MWGWLGFKNNNDNQLGKKITHNNHLGNKPNELYEEIETEDVFNNLSPEEKISALISKSIYDDNKKTNIGGYIYQPEDSYDNMNTYYNPKLNKVIIGHRGSKFSSAPMSDLFSDAIITFGIDKTYDPRFNRNKERIDSIIDKYGKDTEYQHTGHSLGGSHSKAYGKLYGHKSINFNTGSGLDYIWGKEARLRKECEKPNPPKYCNLSTDISISGDILSKINNWLGIGYGKKKVFTKPSLGMFDILKKHKIKTFLNAETI